MSSSEITEATVMFRQIVHVGSRVKHWGQRYTGCATATVTGFKRGQSGWITVLVERDAGHGDAYGDEWNWDRTEAAPDIGRTWP